MKALSTSPAEPDKPTRWKNRASLALVFTGSVLSVAASVAQLGVFSTKIARVILIAVVLSGVLYFAIKSWHSYFLAKVRELRAQLAAAAEELTLARSAHQLCLDAIERISDRERPLFSESLEITVVIGDDDASDLIIERRITTPKPLVTNRSMRPIIPTYREQIASLEGIAFTVHRDDGLVTFIPLREQINKLKVWLVFDPPISRQTEWRVEYRPKGLWRPLRERGFDQLGWDDRLQMTNGTPSAFTSFTAVFTFPPCDQQPIVNERHGHGRLETPEQNADHSWKLTWCDAGPAGRRYDWDITYHRPPSGP